MFIMTEEWLHRYYGSKNEHQERDAINWLNKYGTDVPPDELNEWARWKHLVEYQVNTLDIVARAKARIGTKFGSELDAHLFVNRMRVPGQSEAYMKALRLYNPTTIMELGVGGDSAISTAVFLSHIENKSGRRMLSVDRNPLGCTWDRYEKYPFWRFIQGDSVEEMMKQYNKGQRFDMVFIDTIHDYTHTTRELNAATLITDVILMDDVTFEGNEFDDAPGGVKKAIADWREDSPIWQYIEYVGKNVGVMTKVKAEVGEAPKQEPKRRQLRKKRKAVA